MSGNSQFDVTVVIPTFNYGQYLARAVESVLSQTISPSPRVVVVDDGSTDETPQVAAMLKDRICYLRQENQGVSAARNRGLNEVQTDWIVFLDADDRLLPDAFSHISESVHKHPEAKMHFGHYRSLRADGSVREAKRQPVLGPPLENFRRLIQRRLTISTGTACYHREVFQQIRYPVGMTHGEHIVVDGQILANYPAASIPYPLAEILDHPGRTRDNIEQLKRCGRSTVEAMFDPTILPAEAMRLKPLFVARWNLTLARACYRAGDYREARRLYQEVAHHRWQALCDVTHGLRYLGSLLRAA